MPWTLLQAQRCIILAEILEKDVRGG